MSATKVIQVKGVDPYDITIGRALLGEVGKALGSGVKKVLVIHPVGLTASAELLKSTLDDQGYEAILAGVPDSEDAKRVEVAAFCWGVLGQADFTRSDAVIGFGGGSTTDLAGFVAATWLRGVKLIQVPTTLLAMVDAAIGGKTGINTAEGKNLVGCFYAPSAVIIDLDTLESLPQNEILAGFGEVVKYGFIADERILELIEEDVAVATDSKSDVFAELIERSVAIKARVVGEDFKEAGLREILNYGHTLGHAVELDSHFSLRHGECVAIGMAFMAQLQLDLGLISKELADDHTKILNDLGLPITYKRESWTRLLSHMSVDKKSRGKTLRFVTISAIGKTERLENPDAQVLYSAFEKVSS